MNANDTAPQHFTMSLDGFVAGPDDRMDRAPADGVTFLNCHLAEAVRIGLAAANGKNLDVTLPSIDTPLRREASPC